VRRLNHPVSEALRCSFCHKPQETVGKLISSPSDYPRAYICDECIRVCAAILHVDEDPPLPNASDLEPNERRNSPLLSHPLASEFMTAVLDWLRQESLGAGAGEFAAMRNLALRMVRSKL